MDSIFNLAVIVQAVDQLTGPAREMAQAIGDLDKMAERGRSMQQWGVQASVAGALTQGAADRMWGALQGPINAAADFEQSMAGVRAVTDGITGEEFEMLTAQARQLGSTTAFSASQAADGMMFLARAGFTANEQFAAMPSMLALARAGSTELGQAADIASNILSGFGLEAEEMTRVADVMVQTFTTANTDIPMLGDTMKYIAPVARAAGMSLEESAAMAGLLGNAGIQASMAGTTLRSMLQRLAAPGGAAAGMLEELGISIADGDGNMRSMVDLLADVGNAIDHLGTQEQLQIISTIFGQRAAAGAAEMLSQGTSIAEYVERITDSGGRAAQVAADMADNYRGAQTEFASAMEGLQITLGQFLLPTLTEVARVAVQVTQGLMGWAEANPGLARTALMIALIAAGALMIVAPILSVVGGFMTMAGVGLVAIARIGVAFVWLVPKIVAASGALLGFVYRMALAAATAIPSFLSGLAAMGAALMGRVLMGIRAVTVAARAMGLAFLLNPVVLIAAAIAGAAYLIWTHWEPISAFFVSLWSDVQGAFEGFSNWLSGWWETIASAWEAMSWDGLIPDFDWSALIPPLSWDQFVTALDWLSWVFPLRWLDFIPGFSWAGIIGAALDWGAWITTLDWVGFVSGLDWSAVLTALDWASWVFPLRWLDFIPGFSWAGVMEGALDWGAYVASLDWTAFVSSFDWSGMIPDLDWGDVLTALDWASWLIPLRWLDFIPGFSWAGIIGAALDWGAWITTLDWVGFVSGLDWSLLLAPIEWLAFVPGITWEHYLAALDWASWVVPLRWLDFIPGFSWAGLLDGVAAFDWSDLIPDLDWSTIIPDTPEIDWTAVPDAMARPFEMAFETIDAIWGRLQVLFEWSPIEAITAAFGGIGETLVGFISDAADMAGSAWNRITSMFSSSDAIELAARDPASIERATRAADELAAALDNVAGVDMAAAQAGVDAVSQASAHAIASAGGIPIAADEAVRSARSIVAQATFYNEGVALMVTLAAGIRAGAAQAVEAVRDTVQTMRDHLPHSPAKIGPLSDLHRVRFAETLAEAVRPAPAIEAVRRLTAGMAAALAGAALTLPAAAAQLPSVMPADIPSLPAVSVSIPQVGIMPGDGGAAPGRAAATGEGPVHIDINFNPTVTMPSAAGGGDSFGSREQMQELLRSMGHELVQLIEDELGRIKRLDY